MKKQYTMVLTIPGKNPEELEQLVKQHNLDELIEKIARAYEDQPANNVLD